ncbi:conserved protein, unknown function [Plasmodium reichenowi]|uniref:Calponin-homology (CH) domain-containing protein n=1 Tax=Plasmodium reichenowi TaxID=5854 RepID=A0A060RXM8_PLARE|nr:conserved protein, unknown function [Plasmodium reichenowi]KYN98589.1 conserved protein, unknown function [Plasmodium reichenowi]CDO64354.1 conserved protein, unknown function [Plasmodium reichenowi]
MSKNELVKIVSKVREDELNELHEWLNNFTLSRKIKNVNRDFSDGVLMAELVNSCLPRFVELHNYSKANSINQKRYNWNTLNEKVFKRLDFKIDKKNVEEIVNSKCLGVEKVLITFKKQLFKFQNEIKEEEDNLNHTENNNEENSSDNNNISTKENNLDEMNSENFHNDEIIKILKYKIFNLEKLLKIKDSKIDILNKKIDTLNRMKNSF